MAKIDSNKVLGAITSMPLSATAIAKKLGLNKGNQVQDQIDELVDQGLVTADNSGRFTVYVKAEKKETKKGAVATTTTAVAAQPGECKVIPDSGKATTVSMPDELLKDLQGYTITRGVTNKSGQLGTRIVTPITDKKTGKKKSVFIKEGFTLVIINDKPSHIVNTPTQLILACHQYAEANGIHTYGITQPHVGVINGADDVKMSDIVCVTIKRIDKGAAK